MIERFGGGIVVGGGVSAHDEGMDRVMRDFVLALVSGATSRGEECSGLAAVGVQRHWGAEVVFSLICALARLTRIPFGLACVGVQAA